MPIRITPKRTLKIRVGTPVPEVVVNAANSAVAAASSSAASAAAAQAAQHAAEIAEGAAFATVDSGTAELISNPVAGPNTQAALKARELAINPFDHGAVGDGVTDDTAAWQACADIAAATPGTVITGKGKTFRVSSVIYRASNLVVRDADFITKAGSNQKNSPITINGDYGSTAQFDRLTFLRITIDGNRTQQTNLGGEDGGCFGFRIMGKVTDVLVTDCAATNCATDGLAVLGADSPLQSAAFGMSSRISIIRCRFNNNRRHGASADSVQSLTFSDCELTGNGFNADGGTSHGSPTDGASGALMPVTGLLYGNGADIEEYHVKTRAEGVTFERCVMTGNARGSLLFHTGPVKTTDPGFTTRTGFTIKGCTLDNGASPDRDVYAVTFTPANDTKALPGYYYDDITLSDNRITGMVGLTTVKNVYWAGGKTSTPEPFIANLEYVEYLKIAPSVDRSGKAAYVDEVSKADYGDLPLWISAPEMRPTDGAASAAINGVPCITLGDSAYGRVGFWVITPSDWRKVQISATVARTGASGGKAFLALYWTAVTDGAAITSATGQAGAAFTVGGQNAPVPATFTPALQVPGRRVWVEIVRDGPNGSDTLAGDLAMIGVSVQRVS